MDSYILDLGLNNLASVSNALSRIGRQPIQISSGAQLEDLSQGIVVLPGTGNFGAACQSLDSRGFRQPLLQMVGNSNFTLLGICLGMQLLLDESHEAEGRGLGIIGGDVATWSNSSLKTHIGWSQVTPVGGHKVSPDLPEDFYFVHSFHCRPKEEQSIWLRSQFHQENFVSGVRFENVFGVQFHPEKSSGAGQRLLEWIVRNRNA